MMPMAVNCLESEASSKTELSFKVLFELKIGISQVLL